jgi:integrase
VVGVWTAEQTAEFLRQVRGHRLYTLFHLVALRGLRRGEAVGLRWSDLDLDAGALTVSEQLQARTVSVLRGLAVAMTTALASFASWTVKPPTPPPRRR